MPKRLETVTEKYAEKPTEINIWH